MTSHFRLRESTNAYKCRGHMKTELSGGQLRTCSSIWTHCRWKQHQSSLGSMIMQQSRVQQMSSELCVAQSCRCSLVVEAVLGRAERQSLMRLHRTFWSACQVRMTWSLFGKHIQSCTSSQ